MLFNGRYKTFIGIVFNTIQVHLSSMACITERFRRENLFSVSTCSLLKNNKLHGKYLLEKYNENYCREIVVNKI